MFKNINIILNIPYNLKRFIYNDDFLTICGIIQYSRYIIKKKLYPIIKTSEKGNG